MFYMYDEGREMGCMWHVTYFRDVNTAHKVWGGGSEGKRLVFLTS
jgi:hypothetical protein